MFKQDPSGNFYLDSDTNVLGQEDLVIRLMTSDPGDDSYDIRDGIWSLGFVERIAKTGPFFYSSNGHKTLSFTQLEIVYQFCKFMNEGDHANEETKS